MRFADTSNPPPPWDGQDTLHALGLAAVVVSVLSIGSVPLVLSGVLLILGGCLIVATWDPKRHGGEG